MSNNSELENIDRNIYRLGKGLSLVFIFLAFLCFLILLLPLLIENYDFQKLGSLGDTAGGFLNPIVAIAAALLTFLAFYVQFQANKQITNQFEVQKKDDENNFEYNRLKERIYLIIKEIDGFDVAFHNGTVIRRVDEITGSGKKYNFNGVQGMNLFAIAFYEQKDNKVFKLDDSSHSIAMQIQNLLVLVYNTHVDIGKSFLKLSFKEELIELLTYTYQSKLAILIEHHIKYVKNKELIKMLKELKATYYRLKKS